MGTQGAGRKRSTNKDKTTAEDDALNLIAREAEARLAAKRAARAEAREIRMKELERQQKEKYYGLSPKADDRQDSKWGDIEQWMEDSERYTRSSRIHTLSDEDERMSVGSRGSVRSDLDIVGAYAGGGDSPYSHKKSKKKKKHKHKDKDRNGYDDDYSVMSSRSSRLSDESRMSRSSRLDLTSSVLDESRASRSSRLDLQPTSYASSDLYSLNGLSSSRPALYNGYQRGSSLSQVPLQIYRRSSLYEDSLCGSSRRGNAQVPLDYSSYRSSGSRSGSRTSSRASSRAGSARTSPVDTGSSSVASFLRSAVNSGLPRDLDDVTIPDFSDVEDGNYLEKGSRAASALTATTLTSLGGTSSRRGSGETALTLDAETSIREIKEIHELKDQIQDVESKFNQNLKEAKDKLAEVEEKYRKAMVSNAQLDNEKNNLMYQVDTLKDSLMELEEQLAESRREYEDKAKDFEREKHAHTVLQFQFNELKETLKQSEELLNEIRQLRIKEEGFQREISDLQETVDWKDKKISALERQKEYTDAIRIERDELREEVVKLKDILKKHGIVLGPDLNINGGVTEALNTENSSSDPNSQPTQETPISPTEGTNSMLGNSEEETKETSNHPTQETKLEQNQEMHDDTEKQHLMIENSASIVEICANEDQPEPNIEHSNANTVMMGTDQVDTATSVEKNVIEFEPIEQKDTEHTESEEKQTIENAEIKPTSQENLEEIINVEKVDSTQLTKIEPMQSDNATEDDALTKDVKNIDPVVATPKIDIQQDLETQDGDSEDVSAKSHVASSGGKKKKRKKRGKKKGATSEDKKEQNTGSEKQTKSDGTTGDGGSAVQANNELLTDQKIQENTMENEQVTEQITLVDDFKDGKPTTQIVEQTEAICDIDADTETKSLINELNADKIELKATIEETSDDQTQDIVDMDQINLVEATKQLQAGSISDIEKDTETSSLINELSTDKVEESNDEQAQEIQQTGPICDTGKDTEANSLMDSLEKAEQKVTLAEADTTSLETDQAEVSCGEAATGTTCNSEGMDSPKSKEKMQSLDNIEQEIESEASLETHDGNGNNVAKIDSNESDVDVAITAESGLPSCDCAAMSEKDNTDEVQKQNAESQSTESEQATTSITNSQMDDSQISVQDDDLKESLVEIEEPKLPENLEHVKDTDSCIEETSTFDAQDAILNNCESATLQNMDSNQEPTANDAMPITASDIDKVITEINLIEESKDAEIIPTKNDTELKSSQSEPDDASSVVTECKYDDKEVEESSIASGEFKSTGKESKGGVVVLVREYTEEAIENLDRVDTNIENTVQIDSESMVEELKDLSHEDEVASREDKVEVGLDVLVEDNSKDQLINTESPKEDQNMEDDHKELEIVDIKTDLASQNVEQPEESKDEEIKALVDTGVEVLVEDDNSKNTQPLTEMQSSENCYTEDVGSQNEVKLQQLATKEEEVELGFEVSVEEDLKDQSINTESQNDNTELENPGVQPQNDSDVLACQTVDLSENNVEFDAKQCPPTEQGVEEEEDEGEGLSFDFDDLEMEAAIAQSSEPKTINEEFEVGVEVLADEASLKDDSNDNQQEVISQNDNGNKNLDILNNKEELEVTNNDEDSLDGVSLASQSEISQDEIGAASEHATVVQDAKQNSSENNNKQSSPMDDGGSDLVKTKDLPSGKKQTGSNSGQNRSGKDGRKGSKKGKGKGKDECKMN